MARKISQADLKAILEVVGRYPNGVGSAEIARELTAPPRTLQARLKRLVGAGRLAVQGKGRLTRYSVPSQTAASERAASAAEPTMPGLEIPLSAQSVAIRNYLRQPIQARKPSGYNRDFLDEYRPNSTFYLSAEERHDLAKVGNQHIGVEPAGTYAKQILHRLLIDLSWNSSRLEGNTYSLLDTKRLIDFGEEAPGRDRLEAQMIVNHKEAIEFLVSSAEEIGFNRYTILNLHGILANNLLANEGSAGRLRHIAVGIERSTFHPLEVPQLIQECFDQILATAAAIEDPFEQALFVMVQLPYLQPFDDVNKRVSRLAANIPFIQKNLTPLSFIDVPRVSYTDAMLGVYELNDIHLLKDIFVWAYKRSSEQYAAVRQSVGEPDPFRMKHSAALRQVVSEVVRGGMGKRAATAHITGWAGKNITAAEQQRFQEMTESVLLNLHEGNFARYHIRPSEFAAWKPVWETTPAG